MEPKDLNEMEIPTDCGHRGYRSCPMPLKDFSSESGNVHVYFKKIADHLVGHIDRADVVVGCVAWLTHASILESLARKRAVSLIVQKEDFLRPDSGTSRGQVRRLYADLRSQFTRDNFPLLDRMMDGRDLDAVRCVGLRSNDRQTSIPRMHHKFVVFCKWSQRDLPKEVYQNTPIADLNIPDDEPLNPTPEPYAVWTGSFNFTNMATLSFENAVYVEDREIAHAYFGEWEQIAALSEPLDWESMLLRPEWRMGWAADDERDEVCERLGNEQHDRHSSIRTIQIERCVLDHPSGVAVAHVSKWAGYTEQAVIETLHQVAHARGTVARRSDGLWYPTGMTPPPISP
jgi:hypothetical protein